MNDKTSFIAVDGINTRLIERGTGTPLFFLHGWGCNAETMLSLSKTFSATHRCYFFDFPGFGQTPPPPLAWEVGDYAAFTFKLISQVCPDSSVSVLAHSFGGRVMLKLLASKDTSSLFGKVLITGGAGMRPLRSFRYYYRVSLAKLLKAPLQVLPSSLRERGLQGLRGTRVWKSLGSSEYSQLQGVMREVFVKTVREYLEETLPHIEHEILLLWGEQDAATPLYQAKRLEKGLKNGALVTIAGAGHYAFLDQPVKFSNIARAYLG